MQTSDEDGWGRFMLNSSLSDRELRIDHRFGSSMSRAHNPEAAIRVKQL